MSKTNVIRIAVLVFLVGCGAEPVEPVPAAQVTMRAVDCVFTPAPSDNGGIVTRATYGARDNGTTVMTWASIDFAGRGSVSGMGAWPTTSPEGSDGRVFIDASWDPANVWMLRTNWGNAILDQRARAGDIPLRGWFTRCQ